MGSGERGPDPDSVGPDACPDDAVVDDAAYQRRVFDERARLLAACSIRTRSTATGTRRVGAGTRPAQTKDRLFLEGAEWDRLVTPDLDVVTETIR